MTRFGQNDGKERKRQYDGMIYTVDYESDLCRRKVCWHFCNQLKFDSTQLLAVASVNYTIAFLMAISTSLHSMLFYLISSIHNACSAYLSHLWFVQAAKHRFGKFTWFESH